MSGGPYGRGKAPERACLKLQDWPEKDRRLWEAACKPGDLPDAERGGARANHAIMSNRKAEKGYGRWLTFLQIGDPDSLADAPALRITPERVRRYVDSLIGLNNSTASILARLRELGEVARIMGPNVPVADICRKAGISQATYFNWKKRYDGLLPTEMRRLKQLEDENNKLRKVVADLSLDKEMLQDALRRKL
jgi:putative transposase